MYRKRQKPKNKAERGLSTGKKETVQEINISDLKKRVKSKSRSQTSGPDFSQSDIQLHTQSEFLMRESAKQRGVSNLMTSTQPVNGFDYT